MHIKKVRVKNFRLLVDVELAFEDGTTLIVGRNNSGKTSLSEVMQRFVNDRTPKFQIEDFSIATYDEFCNALEARGNGAKDDEVRELVPKIELWLFIEYDLQQQQLGTLSDFIVDLDPNCAEALIVAEYRLRDGRIDDLFGDQPSGILNESQRKEFFQILRERVPIHFEASLRAEDPNDSSNYKAMDVGALRTVLKTEFISAQRGLDDNTSKDSDDLSKIMENLFSAAKSASAEQEEQTIARTLEEAVQEIQKTIEGDFKDQLRKLLPTLKSFGYPGLDSPELEPETTLDVERLLSRHTKVKYAGQHGILLPESYSGLGIRNLIFILLQIVRFYRTFCTDEVAPSVHLLFIEEPEAHLHPQMQEVFIRQVSRIAQQLSNQESSSLYWPVQFVISTHSSHLANAADFESIRYFLPKLSENSRSTKVKDLRSGLSDTSEAQRMFLHQYLTLTKCDLFFADKAILVEGTSERVLLPVIIRKLEKLEPKLPKLSSQYVTVLEVGGAYAHRFFTLLDFLELRTLIITDIDTVDKDGKACPVHLGLTTSNACIKDWFNSDECHPNALLNKESTSKIRNLRRLAYQHPEEEDEPCGRTLEDAFMLANPELFSIDNSTCEDRAMNAWSDCVRIKKSQFALDYALVKTNWNAPRYIVDGLRWLASGISIDDSSNLDSTPSTTDASVSEEDRDE